MTTEERKRKHAEYMREYNARPESHRKKILRDRVYRQKNLDKIQAYDRERNKLLERRAAKWKYGKLRVARDRQKSLNYHARYYLEHKDKARANAKQRRQRFTATEWRDIQRRYRFKHEYGITVEQYEKLLKRQRGKCALCPTPHGASGTNGRLHVDHDHMTNQVRGLLCMYCNHAIERLEKYPDWAIQAVAYLDKAKLKRPR